jgi:tripartite-type tricarboxylate transporter receptor subunit TctC
MIGARVSGTGVLGLRLLGAALALSAACAGAQDFPTRPVRLIVPYPPAGSVDFVARTLQVKLQELWRQPVIVDNRAGASGMIGSEAVAKAAPDGYTLLLGGVQTHAMNVGVIRKMPYDPIRDFTSITQTTRANWILAAHPSTGVKTPAELVATIRAQPDRFSYASSGVGSAAHLAFSTLAAELNLKVIHIPYKGIGPGITDTVSGRVSLVMGDLSTLLPHVKGGRLTAIAMTGAVRSPLIPELPTIAETLIAGFDVQAWQGIYAPAGMNPELARQINAVLVRALNAPDTVERLRAAGVDVVGTGVEEFTEFAKREVTRWVGAAKKANVEPE